MDGDEGRGFNLFGGGNNEGMERRLVRLEQRLAEIETRHVATIDQGEFEKMLMIAFTSDRVTKRLSDMFSQVLAHSDLLTGTQLRNWLVVFFAALGLLFTFLQYLHP